MLNNTIEQGTPLLSQAICRTAPSSRGRRGRAARDQATGRPQPEGRDTPNWARGELRWRLDRR